MGESKHDCGCRGRIMDKFGSSKEWITHRLMASGTVRPDDSTQKQDLHVEELGSIRFTGNVRRVAATFLYNPVYA